MTETAVVVTGASTGIGRATAALLDQRGLRVFAGVRRERDALALRQESSPRLTPLLLDVTDAEAIARAAAAVEDAVGKGGLGGLVNNAGVGSAFPLELVDAAELRRVHEVNVVGLLAVTQAFLPALRRARGRVVNVSSIGGRTVSPFLGPYAASKFAVEALSDALRQELRPSRVGVVVVEPGTIDTPIFAKTLAEVEASLARLPAERAALYAPELARVRAYVERRLPHAVPAERVARVIAGALSAARPRTRYRVGADAHLQAWLARLLPDRWQDALRARVLGLER